MFGQCKFLSLPVLIFCLLFGLAVGCGCDDELPGENQYSDVGVGDDVNDNSGCATAGESCAEEGCCANLICNEEEICSDSGTSCDPAGEACATGATCCSGRCQNNVCAAGGGSCTVDGDSCESAADCCSLSCSGGQCVSDSICASVGEDCDGNSDCCSNVCDGGTCSSGGSCLGGGELCSDDGQCCTQTCIDQGGESRCSAGGNCRVAGSPCTSDGQCCVNMCNDGFCKSLHGADYDGISNVPTCMPVGEVCERAEDCCSYSCYDDGSGFKSCQYLGGCRVRGEMCTQNSDCCMDAPSCKDGSTQGQCYPMVGFPHVGRCDHPPGPGRRVDGEVCVIPGVFEPQGAHDCCGECEMTNVGVARCSEFGSACIPTGDSCSFSSQCCTGLCAPNADGNLVCTGSQCTPEGSACGSNADCCDGNCNSDGICGPEACVPDGAQCGDNGDCCNNNCNPATNICEEITICLTDGQGCSSNSQCCSGVCQNGSCGSACVPTGSSCTSNNDCCQGFCNPSGICEEGGTTCGGPGASCESVNDCCLGLNCDDDGICRVIL